MSPGVSNSCNFSARMKLSTAFYSDWFRCERRTFLAYFGVGSYLSVALFFKKVGRNEK